MQQVTIFEALEKPRCQVPEPDTHPYVLLRAMQDGMRVTIKNAPTLGIGALSQEIGRLKHKYGWEPLIRSQRVTTVTGSRISEYWLEGGEPDAA